MSLRVAVTIQAEGLKTSHSKPSSRYADGTNYEEKPLRVVLGLDPALVWAV